MLLLHLKYGLTQMMINLRANKIIMEVVLMTLIIWKTNKTKYIKSKNLMI
jgi:hypothetical protein